MLRSSPELCLNLPFIIPRKKNCLQKHSIHTALESDTLKVYYCHPYTSCERGSNERNNRIIRRYLPKGKFLKYLTQFDCDRIAADMNDMPRKILGYATARELFEQELAALAAVPA